MKSESKQVINSIENSINSLISTDSISYDLIGDIGVLRDLLQMNPSLITPDLTSKITTLSENQIQLIAYGIILIDPELLKLVDLGLYLSK